MKTPQPPVEISNTRLEQRRGELPMGMSTVAVMLADFEDWLRDWQDEPGRWMAFDQFIRTQLRECVGAARVRCYRISRGANDLEPLTPSKDPLVDSISAREGILGYVTSRGHRYVRTDSLLGPSVHDLALRSADPPAWCFPIRYDRNVMGLVSVGSLRDAHAADLELLESIGCVIALFWGRLTDRQDAARARQIDQGSGVLSRSHFFQAAEQALADGYANHEPMMAMVLAIEGMRRLDDTGLWDLRDNAIIGAGRTIRAKLRSDDLIGRFADDRFVVLMRRIDTALGRMIAEKLLHAVQELMDEAGADSVHILVRCGLAGTGQQNPSLKLLLTRAFAVAERARKTGVNLCDDLDAGQGVPT